MTRMRIPLAIALAAAVTAPTMPGAVAADRAGVTVTTPVVRVCIRLGSSCRDTTPRETIERGAAPAFAIPRPEIRGRSVHIAQVGDANGATVEQTASDAHARIAQNGDRNRTTISQRGGAAAYADVRQSNAAQVAAVEQAGTAGGNTLFLAQAGGGNVASVRQTATGGENGAILQQAGANNQLALTQDGRDNLARLVQSGDGNTMTAEQTGIGNRLVWTQNGSNLSDLAIRQEGRQSLQITQSR